MLPYLQKTTAHFARQTLLQEQTMLSRCAHTFRTEDAATVIFCRMAFRQPEMPEIASNAVFSIPIRRSSAESLVVRKSEMTKFAQQCWLADVCSEYECKCCAGGAGRLWCSVVCRSGMLKVVRGLREKIFTMHEKTSKTGIPVALVQPVFRRPSVLQLPSSCCSSIRLRA